jgi:hypothetical protein
MAAPGFARSGLKSKIETDLVELEPEARVSNSRSATGSHAIRVVDRIPLQSFG